MKRVPQTPMLHGRAVGIVSEYFALRFVAYLPIDSILLHAVYGASEPQKRQMTVLMSVVETMDSLTELYVPSSEVAGMISRCHPEPLQRPQSASNTPHRPPSAPRPYLLIGELGHFSLDFGRVGLLQRLLRHRTEPTHQLDGPG